MAISLEELPRDDNGILQGVWRVLHRDPGYHGPLGHVHVVDGVGQQPAWGRQLGILAAMFGADLFIEPWTGPTPDGFVLGPLTAWTVPGYTPEPCPWRDPSDVPAPLPETLPPPPPEEPEEAAAPAEATETPAPVADALDNVADEDLEALTVDELRALAEKLGADVDARWGARRLIREIRAARG